MRYLPIFLLLRDRPCLIVGGGTVAERKIEYLLTIGARVTVVAPKLTENLKLAVAQDRILHKAKTFSIDHLQGMVLAIAATDDNAVNRLVYDHARQANIPVNVVDQPQLCTFITPARIQRAPLQIAIGTEGGAPILVRALRAKLETLIPAEYGKLAEFMRDMRSLVKEYYPDISQRRRFWEDMLDSTVMEMVMNGRTGEAADQLKEMLLQPANTTGEVYLVGGGPGDPDLLTFRALRLMQQCDIVVYDRLLAPALLNLVRRDAERYYVGKARDSHTLPQEEINQFMVEQARAGQRVLRLKGGDPFIFGRGGEEIISLAEANIPFQIVPGITAASGCASYAGIPLTHRELAHSCVFVTGHMKDGKLDLNWQALVQPRQTLAVYMGVHAMPEMSRQLIAHGMSADTPVAVIQQGTTRQQQVYSGKLQDMPDLIATKEIKPPAMIIIGDVVQLRDKLAWC